MQNHSMLTKSAVATLPRPRVSLVARLQVALKYLIYWVDNLFLNCRGGSLIYVGEMSINRLFKVKI